MIFTGILANQKYWAISTSTKEIGIETKKNGGTNIIIVENEKLMNK